MLHLLDLLFPPRVDERLLRDTPLNDFLALMRPMLVAKTRPEAVMLLPFHNPVVRAAIHEAKYHGSPRAFRYLGAALAEYLRELASDNVGPPRSYILVPVPLGEKRQKERGFNQVDRVIRSALCELGADAKNFTLASDTLIRTRETVSQISLASGAREKNMRGAFRAAPKLTHRGLFDPTATYLIIDDVLTTGATLQAAIDALKLAGATTDTPLALAH